MRKNIFGLLFFGSVKQTDLFSIILPSVHIYVTKVFQNYNKFA